MESIKSISKSTLHQIEKQYNQSSFSPIKNSVINATWNDSSLPKTKHLSAIVSTINSSYNPSSPLSRNMWSTEEILSILEYLVISNKWKVVYKTLTLLLELSTPKYCGDLIFLLLKSRPDLLSADWYPKSKSYAYEERRDSINSILSYLRKKQENFNKHGSTFVHFRNDTEVMEYTQRRFLEKNIPSFLKDNIEALERLTEVTFPTQEFSIQSCALVKRLLYDEFFQSMKNIGVLVQGKTNVRESKEIGEEYVKVCEKIIEVCEKAKKWIKYIDIEKNNNDFLEGLIERFNIVKELFGKNCGVSSGSNGSIVRRESEINDVKDKNAFGGFEDVFGGGDNGGKKENGSNFDDVFGNL